MECPYCGYDGKMSEAPVGHKLCCPRCNRLFARPEPKKKRRRKRSTTRGRSSRQESFNTRQVGGRMTLNSGALDDKADVKVPGLLRDENKTTSKRSFSLKLDDLKKVAAAAKGDEIPVLTISFEDNLKQQYRVISDADFLHLLELEKEYRARHSVD